MVIGTVDINLSSCYMEKGHELWNEWLTLSDQKGRRQGSQGQLMVCVTVGRRSLKRVECRVASVWFQRLTPG
jgi:hypothetical protein